MRRRALLATLAAVAAVLAGAGTAAAAPVLPLGHAGRWITDASGRVVVLHGFNMVFKRPPYAPDATGFGDDDAAFLADEGYDAVRVGVIYGAVEPRPGVYDEAYLDRIADTVATLGRHGIVSLLDFHQDLYSERFAGEGFPDWAVQSDGLPAKPSFGFPGNYLLMPALQRAFDHFWRNDAGPGGVGLQDRYAAAWRHVAARFSGNGDVVGYELMNEPWPGTLWQQCVVPTGCPAFDAQLGAFARRTIAAIREADPRTLVAYEPNVLFNNGVATQLPDLRDGRAIFSFHDYCLTASDVPVPGADRLCDAFDDLVFRNAEARAAKTGDALLLTEFGATDDAGVLRAMAERADRTMVGWLEWHYCGCEDPTTSGPGDKQAVVRDPARPPEGDNVDAAKLEELSRPYPQAVAGTPQAWSFDQASSTFRLRFSTDRAGGGARFGPGDVTEVAVPARQYPGGYAAQVDGGAVLSAPGARVLRIGLCPGARDVRVTVTPAGGPGGGSCAVTATRPRLRVAVRPRTVRAGRRTTLRVVVTTRHGRLVRVVRGVRVRAGRWRATTDRGGRARLRVRFARPGRVRLAATRRGLRPGHATVRVRRAPR